MYYYKNDVYQFIKLLWCKSVFFRGVKDFVMILEIINYFVQIMVMFGLFNCV